MRNNASVLLIGQVFDNNLFKLSGQSNKIFIYIKIIEHFYVDKCKRCSVKAVDINLVQNTSLRIEFKAQ